MPLYEFECKTCGPFEQWRTLAEVNNPVCCSTCQVVAQRIFSPPSVLLSGTLRLRDCQNPEPRLVNHTPDQATAPRYQSNRQGRPWMINH